MFFRWITATELNNSGFEIQRGVEKNKYATVGFVRGKGTTTNQNEYTYADKDLADAKYYYRLKQVDFNGVYEFSNVIEVDVRSLEQYALEQNYPNPFNPTTTIGYVLKEKCNAKLTLLNGIGEEIAVLANSEQDKGYHKVDFNAVKLPSGIYFYQLKTGTYSAVKKMLLIK
ncbi:MAG: T9SS type A sorting domain-containing protein [Ignavibacteriales bacterium]|nr:T9SS type A sorting domain-containing protein [Ignavibacteriales bacterium]